MSAMDALGIPKESVPMFKTFLTRAADQQTPCTQTDAEIFWSFNKDRIAQAKALCDTCPLKALCLMYALDARERDGVWGGTDEAERNEILNRRSRAEKATRARQRRAESAATAAAEQAELEPALF